AARARARTLRLPLATVDGCDRDPHRKEDGCARRLTSGQPGGIAGNESQAAKSTRAAEAETSAALFLCLQRRSGAGASVLAGLDLDAAVLMRKRAGARFLGRTGLRNRQ